MKTNGINNVMNNKEEKKRKYILCNKTMNPIHYRKIVMIIEKKLM